MPKPDPGRSLDEELLKQTMKRRRQELHVRGGGPAQLKNSVSEVLAARKIGRVLESRELSKLWENAVDADVAQRTRVVSLRNQSLLVEVSDSVLMSELANFEKRNILRRMQSERTDMQIKNLKFRLNPKLGQSR